MRPRPLKERVLAVVALIRDRRIATYGAIGRYLRISARQVAFVLARLTVGEAEIIPWFRVVAAKGFVSTTKLGAVGRRQIARLRQEGVLVTGRNRVAEFATVAWGPGEWKPVTER